MRERQGDFRTFAYMQKPMTYTRHSKLIMREYGRNIQYLVDYALTLQDDVQRNKLVQDIIDLMGTMNPTLRNVEDFRHKLWDHIFMMSDFRLNAESPYPIPDREKLKRRNMKLSYPKSKVQYAHYGRNIETCIKKAISMEDPDMRQEFAQVIGNYMKLVYQNWNRENVNDDIIMEDMEHLSEGALKLDAEGDLDTLSRSTKHIGPQNQNPNRQKHYQNQNKNYRRYNQNNQGNRNYKKNR